MGNSCKIYAQAFIFLVSFQTCVELSAQKFIHPGMDQNSNDLAHMKKLVASGQQPYRSAFDRLKAIADSGFTPKAHAHVLRGPYGRPNIGGNDLSRSASMAYNYALVWYITNDRKYALKAVDILNAWPPVLHHFDYNDAKLLAAWTGHALCNAAEIMRYTYSGWKQQEIQEFSSMLLTVYYPLLRFYYPQANGNWDGAIIHSILAMSVFTDNRPMFDNAIEHFLHAPVNGSLFKYIYPNGQCQETMRDQAHVQLGLGEFVGAAQIAFTQGIDLFSLGNNRLGLGYEFTASFLLGEVPFSYGRISERAKGLRDDYEYVYRHYAGIGVTLPFTKRAADSIRSRADRSVLSSVRATYGMKARTTSTRVSTIGYPAGATSTSEIAPHSIIVAPGESIQKVLDENAGTNRTILLKAGIHKLPFSLKIPSGITVAGEGLNTVLFLDPASDNREAIVNGSDDLHNVTISNLVVEGSLRTEIHSDPNSTRSYRGGYNRGGILFRSLSGALMKNINLVNLTIQNCTYNGVFISGASTVNITRCNFTENGVSVAPGARLLHNLLLTHCSDLTVNDSRLVTSPLGAGLALEDCSNGRITNCEIARNGYHGIAVSESKDIQISGNLIEANDRSGMIAEYFYNGSEGISVMDNIIQFNARYGLESYATKNLKVERNMYAGNGKSREQERISNNRMILME